MESCGPYARTGVGESTMLWVETMWLVSVHRVLFFCWIVASWSKFDGVETAIDGGILPPEAVDPRIRGN